MMLPITVLEVLAVLAAAAYVQALVSTRTKRPSHAWLVRGLLASAGIGVGLAAMILAPAQPGWSAFLLGFGFIHLPPAAVLFLKRQRPPRAPPPR